MRTKLNNVPPDILIFRNGDHLADFAVQQWEKLALEAVGEGCDFSVALSGGKTPILFYRKLAARWGTIPWERTHIFWVDERFVPRESELSNYRLINETLLKHIQIPFENIHPVPTGVDNPPQAAIKYEEDLKSHFALKRGEFPVFNLIVLGLGEDGHTASLFPARSALSERKRLVIAETSPDISPARVSLTLPVLNNSTCVLFLVSGKNKAAVLKKVFRERDANLPATLVDPSAGRLFFAVDEAAASELSAPE